MAEELGEKTELPTGKRRFDARQRGQVAKSTDLGVAIDLLGAMLLLVVLGPGIVSGCAAVLRHLLGGDWVVETASAGSIGETLRWAGMRTAWIVGPFVGLMFVIAAMSRFLQVGPLLTLKPLEPKLSSFNPIKGVKKIFGKRNLIRTLVSLVKLVAVLSVAWWVTHREYERIAALALLEVVPAFRLIAEMLLHLCIWVLALVLVIGLLDYWYQRWQMTQDLRMTKQEVKDELRSMEGDLAMKGRRLRMARKMLMQQMQQAVPQADVIVTNPTHFSVAIKYDPETMEAPRVVAKGADYMAFRIREIAAAHRVPIVERPPLARALFAGVEVGQQIRPEFYEAVAEILAYVYRLEGRAA